jgi:hypothetical protein
MTSAVASILGAIDQLTAAERQELMMELFQRDEALSTSPVDSPFRGLDRTASKALLIEKLESGLQQVKAGQMLDGEMVFDRLQNRLNQIRKAE